MKIQLSPCAITFDPGFVDRTYMLFFYSEMDPSCLVTPAINLLHEAEDQIQPNLNVSITCPQLDLDFYVPKVDMRKPIDIPTDEFVSLFWSRRIHPELFQLRIRQFDMQLSQDGGPKSPLSITLSSDFLDILFRENETCDSLPLAVVRKSQRNLELKASAIHVLLKFHKSLQQFKFARCTFELFNPDAGILWSADRDTDISTPKNPGLDSDP